MIREFDTEHELDEESEKLEQQAFDHLYLKEMVQQCERELDMAMKELEDFEENHPWLKGI